MSPEVTFKFKNCPTINDVVCIASFIWPDMRSAKFVHYNLPAVEEPDQVIRSGCDKLARFSNKTFHCRESLKRHSLARHRLARQSIVRTFPRSVSTPTSPTPTSPTRGSNVGAAVVLDALVRRVPVRSLERSLLASGPVPGRHGCRQHLHALLSP